MNNEEADEAAKKIFTESGVKIISIPTDNLSVRFYKEGQYDQTFSSLEEWLGWVSDHQELMKE